MTRRVRQAAAARKAANLNAAADALDRLAEDPNEDELLTATVIDPEAPAEEFDDGSGDYSPNNDREKAKMISVMTDHRLKFPELYLSVFIGGDLSEEIAFAQMLVRAGCKRAVTPDEADVVIFTGGEDVDPQLYGAKKHPSTYFRTMRDNHDITLYLECLEKGIPMVGVCRGAQFLHVMNGGKLFQDVDHHNGPHSMTVTRTGELIANISSVHHQMCMPNRGGGMEILGVSDNSRNRWIDDKTDDKGKQQDIEAFFYRATCCFGVQGHPEYKGYNFYTKWFLLQIEDFVNLNPDLVLQDVYVKTKDGTETLNLRRMQPELLEKRKGLVDKALEQACSVGASLVEGVEVH